MAGAKKSSKQNEYRYLQIGLNIAYYRKLAGYTQEELADESNLSRTYIGTIEAPNMIITISLEALFNIADALSIEPYKLLEFRE